MALPVPRLTSLVAAAITAIVVLAGQPAATASTSTETPLTTAFDRPLRRTTCHATC